MKITCRLKPLFNMSDLELKTLHVKFFALLLKNGFQPVNLGVEFTTDIILTSFDYSESLLYLGIKFSHIADSLRTHLGTTNFLFDCINLPENSEILFSTLHYFSDEFQNVSELGILHAKSELAYLKNKYLDEYVTIHDNRSGQDVYGKVIAIKHENDIPFCLLSLRDDETKWLSLINPVKKTG